MGKIMKILKSDKFLLFVFLLVGCLVSMFLKREVLWDFANYHYYNAWALVNGRLWEDVALGGYHAFLNPVADLSLYYLIQYFNDFPNLICFLQGIPFGALLFISFLLFRQYFDEKTWKGRFCIFMALLIVSTGFAVNTQIGSSSNEILVSFLALWGFYLLQREVFFAESPRTKIFFCSGLLMGISMGLKLTSVIYCAGIAITLILYLIKSKLSLKNFICFACGGLAGFLLFHGYWMFLLWQKFDNPFFPFANAWFKSDWMPAVNFRDVRFLPQTWYEYLFFPVIWSSGKFHFYDEMVVTEARWILWFVLGCGYIFYWFRHKIYHIKISYLPVQQAWFFSLCFVLSSYVIWLFLFAIIRYCVVLEVLGALFLVQAVVFLKPKSQKYDVIYFSALNILIFVVLSTPLFSNNWGMRKNTDEHFLHEKQQIFSYLNENAKYDQFLFVENLDVPDGSVVMFVGYPNTFVLPSLLKNANVKAIGYAKKTDNMSKNNILTGMFNKGKWAEGKDKILQQYGDPSFFVVSMMGETSLKNLIPDKYWDNLVCRRLKNNVITRLFWCAKTSNRIKYKGNAHD